MECLRQNIKEGKKQGNKIVKHSRQETKAGIKQGNRSKTIGASIKQNNKQDVDPTVTEVGIGQVDKRVIDLKQETEVVIRQSNQGDLAAGIRQPWKDIQ